MPFELLRCQRATRRPRDRELSAVRSRRKGNERGRANPRSEGRRPEGRPKAEIRRRGRKPKEAKGEIRLRPPGAWGVRWSRKRLKTTTVSSVGRRRSREFRAGAAEGQGKKAPQGSPRTGADLGRVRLVGAEFKFHYVSSSIRVFQRGRRWCGGTGWRAWRSKAAEDGRTPRPGGGRVGAGSGEQAWS